MNSALRNVNRPVHGERLSIIRAAVSGLPQLAIVLIAIFLSSPPASSQVATGFPPFSSQTPSSFDTVNNANLNVHFSIPIIKKGGQGMPFSYALSYDSSVWMPSYGYWYPIAYLVNGWGWRGTAEASTGYVTYYTTQGSCYIQGTGEVYYNIYNFGTYNDPNGTIHTIYQQVAPSNPCPGSPPTSQFTTATDGSGLKFSVTYIPYAQVITPSGVMITPPLNYASPTSGSSSISDANGNAISGSYSTTAATFTDTLGLTPLTVTGSGTPFLPSTYQYTGPGGTIYDVTLTYTTYNIQTNFGCSGIIEYSQSNVPLITKIELPDTSSYTFTYEQTSGYSTSYTTARLTKVTLPTGGSITYAYSGGSQGITCADGSTATLARTVNDNNGNNSAWTYAHTESGSAWSTTITDPQSNQTQMAFQGPYEVQREAYQGSSTWMETVNTCYNGAPIPCAGTGITLPINYSTVQTSLSGVSPSQTSTTYNAYGWPTEVDEYTWGPTLVRKTLTTYDYNTSCGVTNVAVLNRPCTVEVEDSSGNPAAQMSLTYDANGNLKKEVHTNTGGTPSTITRNFTPGSYGVLQSFTDFNANNTQYGTFKCASNNSAFPTKVTLPVTSLVYTLAWDCNGGVPTSVEDPNLQTTSFQYDEFWRLIQINYPDSGKTVISYSDTPPFTVTTKKYLTSSSYHETTQTLDGLGRTIKSQDNSAGSEVDTVYDSIGRVYTVSNPYFSKSDPTYGVTTYAFDPLNRGTSVTAADNESITGIGYSGNTGATALCTTITDPASKARTLCSDALGRIASVAEDPGQSPHLNYQTTYSYDVLNDLTGVNQNQGGETRTYAYDMLSRLTSAQTPEVHVSGTQCSTTYGYDGNGNVISKVAPAANKTSCSTTVTTTYAYDTLNRLTSKSYNDSQTPTAAFFYGDTMPTHWQSWSGVSFSYALGRLVLACTNSAAGTCTSPQTAVAYSYDKVGRTANLWQCTNTTNCGSSTIWNTQYNYDEAGDVLSWIPPVNYTLTNTVNSAQQITEVQSSWVDSYHPQNLAQSIGYTPWGAFSQLTNGCTGSGCTNTLESYTYNQLLQPTMIELGKSGSPSNDSCWVYDYYGNTPTSCLAPTVGSKNNGDVMAYYDYDNINHYGHTANFTYDSVNRLSTAVTSGNPYYSYNLNSNYDAYGNMWCIHYAQTVGNCQDFSYNANNQITSSKFGYDAAGNLTADTLNAYTYDAEGHLMSVSGGASESYTYNALGQQAHLSASSYTWDMVYDAGGNWLGSSSNGAWQVAATLRLGNRPFATYISTNATDFIHLNGLGSTAMTSNYAGTVNGDVVFDPWGDLWLGPPTSPEWHYGAFQYDDSAAGLYPTLFREYSPIKDRWMSPDPMGGDITNPQSLNLYAYVMNNPTTDVDPLGLYSGYCDPDTGCLPPCGFLSSECGEPWPGPMFPYMGGWGEGGNPAGVPPPPSPPGTSGGYPQYPPGITPIGPVGCVDANGEPTWCIPGWLPLLGLGAALIADLAPRRANPQMSPCAQRVFGSLQNNLSGNWEYGAQGQEVGGHFNFLFIYSASSSSYAANAAEAINASSGIPFDSGVRFGTVSSLHIPGAFPAGNLLIITAHLDLFNPLALYGLGIVPHFAVDVVLGHILELLGGGFGC